MPTSKLQKQKIQELKKQYDLLKVGKKSLLQMIDEAEVSETVFNSNAIENSFRNGRIGRVIINYQLLRFGFPKSFISKKVRSIEKEIGV